MPTTLTESMKKTDKPTVIVERPLELVLEGAIPLPGSKSETNRALLMGAFRYGDFSVLNPSPSDDSQIFINFLQAVGIGVSVLTDRVIITGHIEDSTSSEVAINLHHAGTALRFITAFSCFLNGKTVLDGSERLRKRPVKPLIDSLQAVGAQIEYLGETGYLPVRVTGTPNLRPTSFTVNVSQSSQMLSALMLLAPVLDHGARLYFDSNQIASPTYVELTRRMLAQLGVKWKANASCLELESYEITADRYTVEADWSGASYWLALAATNPSSIELLNLRADSLQGDAGQSQIFGKWGLTIRPNERGIYVENTLGNLIKPIEQNLALMPDLAQTFAVLSLFADKPSLFTGLHTLPLKETDRILALATEINKLGAVTESGADFIRITPRQPLHQTEAISTWGDHRMAMSFAILVNLLDRIVIEEPAVVSKSYPDFWKHLASAGYTLTFSE